MQTFIDADGNTWNVKLRISDSGKLMMFSTAFADFEPLEVDLNEDDIIIRERK